MRLHRLIPRFLGSGLRHDEAVRLLPWYVNGSLKAAEQGRVHHHVCRCDACRAEIGSLRALQQGLRQLPVPCLRPTAFDSLMASIERLEQAPVEMSAGHVRASARPTRAPVFGWASLTWLSPPAMVPVAAAVGLLLAIAVLGSHGVSMRSADYRTLGSSDPVASGSGRDLRVVFEPAVDRSQIEALADTVHGRLVDGPSELGVYTIRIDADAGAVTRAAERLRTNPRVSFAEPAAPPFP